jgi:hypothetical protein
MRFKSQLIIALIFGLSLNAQTLTEKEIMGEWNTLKVLIPDEVPQKNAVKFMTDAFTGSKFNFQGNKLFYFKEGKTADKRIKELFFLDGENWKINNDKILVGTENNGFSTMHITVQKNNGKIYFVLPMMSLEMEKISDDEPSEPKTSKNKSDFPVYESQVENVDVVTREIDEKDLIPFAVIENPPLAPDCKEKWNNEKKKECTSKYIQMHVARKFNTELASEVGISGKIRIMNEFVIDVEGNPINITASGGPEIMNQNAIDVIGVLPKLKPGMKDGKPINVSYKMPLLFQVED